MKILSITAGAAGMYCGSCFRDNALAAELMARGHEVTLVPVYTPTRTDEANVSQRRVLFGGISVYLQQYSSLFRSDTTIARSTLGFAVVHRACSRAEACRPTRVCSATSPSRCCRASAACSSKEFDKLVDWIRDEPLPDVINLPNSLLIGMARPLRAAIGRPICCTLQGEELFLNGLQAPYRDRAIALIREQVRTCRPFHRRQRLLRHLHVGPVRHSSREEWPSSRSGIRMDGYQRARRSSARVLCRLLRADRARKGLARPRRSVCPPATSNGAGAGAPGRRRLHGRRPDVVSERRARHSRARGSRRRVHLSRRGRSRRQVVVSSASSTCCRCPRPTTSRRACSCSKRWRRVCRSFSRDAAGSSKSSRRPAAVFWSSRTIRWRSLTGSTRCGRMRRGGRHWVSAHFRVCAPTTRSRNPRIGCSMRTSGSCRASRH